MENPFADLMQKKEVEEHKVKLLEEQRREKRDALYAQYSPMVNEVLDLFIAACIPGSWKKGSDDCHAYCCHINWFAGPAETHHANYDEHHDIRRHIEITMEQDDECNPVGFKVTNHENHKIVHVGLSREDVIRGIREAFA